MGLFSNRLRTIVGEDASLGKSLSRLFYYAANKKRLSKLVFSTIPFIKKKITYDQWLKQSNSIDEKVIINEILAFPRNPKLSVVVFGDQEKLINETILSLNNQRYSIYKIYVSDKIYNTFIGVLPIDLLKINPNLFDKEEFILFLNAGDLLSEDCLFEVAKRISEEESIKCIYFDEDIITPEGERLSPKFKPGWSPDLLANTNYVEHAFMHHSLFKDVQLESNYAQSFTYKLLRSFNFKRDEIINIKKVLLSTTVLNINELSENDSYPKLLSESKLISIIIPTRNKSELVNQCILSIIDTSTYKNFEIVLVDNRSDEVELKLLLQEFMSRKDIRFKVVYADIDFNFSKICNIGVENCEGELLVFLNNDVKIISPDWLEQMAYYAQQDHIGATGAKLLYPDNTIQHAGIVLEQESISRHLYLGKEEKEVVENNALNFTRNYLALTAACLMISRDKFNSVGGFDPQFEVEFNDIDLCLKLYEKNLYNVFVSSVKIFHFESSTRRHPHSDNASYKRHLEEVALMNGKWMKYLLNDPYNTKRF